MATLGRWRGTNVAALPNSTTFGAPSNLFGTQVRNDSSAYTFTASTSTLTLPSTGLADGYLLMARVETDDTSNGRFNPIGQIVQASGTGTFVNSPGAGYSRDTSEDRAYFNTWAFVHNPSASSTYQFQWKRDVDAATGTTIIATFDVIPFYYNDVGIYTSTSSALYGGTTPNQVTGWTGTNGTNITLASNAVTCAADSVKYLCLGSQYYEGRGGRTQRWMGWRVGGTKIDYGKSYAYYRSGSDDSNGGNFFHMFETATANVTVDQFCYRGDGVAAGQGGADVDGSTPTLGDHAMVIMELNSNAEGFHTIDNTGGVDLNVVAPVDHALCRTAAITFNDAASFTRSTDTAMDVTAAADIFVAANISAAQELVATASRWTAQATPTVNGTADTDIFHGNYARNNQGTQDTFGWSCNVAGFIGASAGDDIGIETLELAGGEDGGQFEVQPNWSGFLGLNLDTLEAAAVDTTPDQFTFTDQTGVAVSTQQTSNTITVAGMDAGQSVTVTVTGGTYSKNSGAYTSASGTAQNGDTFSVRHTSSAAALTAVNTTLTIETVSDTFTTTTAAASGNIQYTVTSGEITLGGVQTFFGDTGSIALGDLYRNGGIVPDITENAAVPTTGEIANSDMYGVYKLGGGGGGEGTTDISFLWSYNVTALETADLETAAGQTLQAGDMLVALTAGGFGDPPSSNSTGENWSVAYEDGNTTPSERLQYYFVQTEDVGGGSIGFSTRNGQWLGIVAAFRGVDQSAFSSTSATSSSGSWTALFIDDTSLRAAASSITPTSANGMVAGWNVITNNTTTYAGTVTDGTYRTQYQYNNGQPRSLGMATFAGPPTSGGRDLEFDLTGGGTDTGDFYLFMPQATDFTPAAINFNNVNVVNGPGTTFTNSQTISGIDNVIELRVVTTTGDGDAYSIRPRVNGNFFITTAQNSPADFTIRVSNGDSLDFFLETDDRTENGSVTITNVSDGNATIDTFSVTLEVD